MRPLGALDRALMATGAALVALGVGGPVIDVPRTAEGSGPRLGGGPETSGLKIFVTPAIDAGRTIELAIHASRPGAVSLALAPVDELTLATSGPPVIRYSRTLDEAERNLVVHAPIDARYSLFLSAVAGAYTWRLSSAWSPLFEVRSGIVFGVLLAFAGFAALYHDNLRARNAELLRRIAGQPVAAPPARAPDELTECPIRDNLYVLRFR